MQINVTEEKIKFDYKYFGARPDLSRAAHDSTVLAVKDTARIGTIGDIHHNTKLLVKVLEVFHDMGVNIIFLLGDYSSLPHYNGGSDPADLRYRQYLKVIELVRGYQEKTSAQIVCIMGNHEIEDWYFSPQSSSRQKMHASLKRLRDWGWHLPSKPFNGYEFKDGIYLYVYGHADNIDQDLTTKRTFNLAHAISKPVVATLYQGYPKTTERMNQIRIEIAQDVGKVWQDYIDDAAVRAEALWQQFLVNTNDKTVIEKITYNIRSALSFDLLSEKFIDKQKNGSEKLSWFLNLPNEQLAQMAYFWNRYDDAFEGLDGKYRPNMMWNSGDRILYNSFFKTLHSSGAGADYTISGHFHADIGHYIISNKFGSIGLAGSGFEMGKVISDELTCYIIENKDGYDNVFKLSAPAHMDGRTHAQIDLSGTLSEFMPSP